jgi:hypothetical protein
MMKYRVQFAFGAQIKDFSSETDYSEIRKFANEFAEKSLVHVLVFCVFFDPHTYIQTETQFKAVYTPTRMMELE